MGTVWALSCVKFKIESKVCKGMLKSLAGSKGMWRVWSLCTADKTGKEGQELAGKEASHSSPESRAREQGGDHSGSRPVYVIGKTWVKQSPPWGMW